MDGWKIHCRRPIASTSTASFPALPSLCFCLSSHRERRPWRPAHSLPNLVSLAAGKPTEDGGRSECDKIKDKEASRAGNERGFRIFSSILIILSALRTLPEALDRVSSPTRCYGNKGQVLGDMFGLSASVTALTPEFKKSLTTVSCQTGYQSR